MFQRPMNSAQPLLVRRRRNHFIDQLLCCVLKNSSGISARIARDYSTGNVGSPGVNSGQLHRSRIRERFVPVVSFYEKWCFTGDWINELFGRKFWPGPLCFVPTAAENPFAFRHLFRLSADALHKLFRALGICEINLIELRATLKKMHVRVVASWQHQLASGVNHLRALTAL